LPRSGGFSQSRLTYQYSGVLEDANSRSWGTGLRSATAPLHVQRFAGRIKPAHRENRYDGEIRSIQVVARAWSAAVKKTRPDCPVTPHTVPIQSRYRESAGALRRVHAFGTAYAAIPGLRPVDDPGDFTDGIESWAIQRCPLALFTVGGADFPDVAPQSNGLNPMIVRLQVGLSQSGLRADQ